MAEGLDAFVRRGRAHRAAGELEAAVGVFAAAIAAFPREPRPWCERGAVRILQGRAEDALADYRAAEALDPAYPGLRSYFAEAWLYLGRPGDALAATAHGLATEPGDVMHRVNLAHALLFLGRREAALAEYRTLRGERHPTKGLTGAEIAREDLRQLRAAGMTPAAMEEVEQTLADA